MITRLTKIGAAGAIALAALFVSGAGFAQTPNVLHQVEGYWGWAVTEDDAAADDAGPDHTCNGGPLHIWMSEAGRRYNSRWTGEDDEIATGRVLMLMPDHHALQIQYDGEERLDPDGNPVSWVLLMTSPDSFIWVRRDWIGTGNSTRPMVRCEDPNIG